MRILKPREKAIAIVAGVILSLLIWMYFVLQPIQSFERNLDADLQRKNLKLYEARKILAISPENSLAKDFLKQHASQGAAQEDMSRLIKEIQTAATTAGLKVLEIKSQPLLRNVGWFELNVNISFEGRFSEVVGFLYELDYGTKSFLVNEITLESNSLQQTSIRGRLVIGRLLVEKSVDF